MENIEKNAQMASEEETELQVDPVEEEAVGEKEACRTDDDAKEHREHHHHHHHSSHHHHHHRRKHRSSSKRKKTSFKKLWAKNKKVLMPIFAILAIAVVFGGVVLAVDLFSRFNHGNGGATDSTSGTVVLSASVFQEPVSLNNTATKAIINNEDMTVPVHVILENYNPQETRLDVSQPVKLSFHVVNQPKDYQVDRFVVEVAENAGFTDARAHTLDAGQKELNLYNLKTGTQYYYRVNVYFTNSAFSTIGGAFQTEEGPRILTVGGVRNARDVGGWKTVDGKTVKQGLLFRGTEMDGKNDEFKLTEEGKDVLLNILKVKTDMDLRAASEIPEEFDPLGETVQHIYYGTAMYTDIFQPNGAEPIRKVFSDLADPENYPVYMHCIYGRDRTGTVTTLLLGLLGVSEDDLNREYQLTALYNKNIAIAYSGFISQLKGFEGDSIQEKTETYLLSIGVTEAEIASIRSIFLG